MLLAHLLPRWVGWVAVAFGVLGLALLLVTGDLSPFVAYVPMLVIGVGLLARPPSREVTEDLEGTGEARTTPRTA